MGIRLVDGSWIPKLRRQRRGYCEVKGGGSECLDGTIVVVPFLVVVVASCT